MKYTYEVTVCGIYTQLMHIEFVMQNIYQSCSSINPKINGNFVRKKNVRVKIIYYLMNFSIVNIFCIDRYFLLTIMWQFLIDVLAFLYFDFIY